MTLFSRFSDHIGTALDALAARDALPAGLDRSAISVEPPRDPAHGDVATNAAMVLSKPAGMNPRALADLLVAELGAAFLSNEAGILNQIQFDNSAAYLASWIEKLENDPRMIVSAASGNELADD